MSIRFQADNDLRYSIVKAVRLREPAIDLASAQESGFDGVEDSEILDRAAAEGRIVITHDRRTMLNHFRGHLSQGKTSPGLLIVSQAAPISQVVEAVILLWTLAAPADLRNQIYHLPSLKRHVFPH